MERIIIEGPANLKGTVSISSSKNATLPIIAATILNKNPVTLHKLPKLQDIKTMCRLLEHLGVKITFHDKNETSATFDASYIHHFDATYDLVKTMRASSLVLGPLLARFGQARLSLPGGCAIGARPIDMHLEGLKKLGALINLEGGYVDAQSEMQSGIPLKAAEINLPFPSVGATENLMMAACLAPGLTVIKNVAMEPEIEDLANFLNAQGAQVKGAGTNTLMIEGVKELKNNVEYTPIPDRIEAATYMCAAAMTNSNITIDNCNVRHLDAVMEVFAKMGLEFHENSSSSVTFMGRKSTIKGVTIDTAPYPGVPTDVQAQLMALATQLKSPSIIIEHIFENRFMHVPELNRMGANITIKKSVAHIPGSTVLSGAPVMCTDLRASAALILAALVAKGQTEIRRVYHLHRGYENLVEKLTQLGAQIKSLQD